LKGKEMSFTKNLMFAALSLFGVSGAYGNERCCVPQPVVVKSVTACDIVRGFGCYTFGVTKKITHGAKTIIAAPFDTEVNIPHRYYIYHPGYYVSGRLEQIHPVHPDAHVQPTPTPDTGGASNIPPVPPAQKPVAPKKKPKKNVPNPTPIDSGIDNTSPILESTKEARTFVHNSNL
jgi:hypothetical protein